MIKEIYELNYLNECDKLLELLIRDEQKYDNLLISNFKIENYFSNVVKNKDNILLGYVVDNHLVGYIFVKKINDDMIDKNLVLIDGLYVIEGYRKKGIGTSLIKEALKRCSINDVQCVEIRVMANNKNAIKI